MQRKIKQGIIVLVLMNLLVACQNTVKVKNIYFSKAETALEAAIKADDADAVKIAIKQGANPNAVGLHGVTPIIVTAGNLKFNAMKALIESGANPNTYDKNGDNAVTLAATTYKNGDKRYLEYLLDHGGDVNSKLPNRDPLFKRIAIMHDLKAIRWLINKGADINVITRTGQPLVYSYASSIDWDTAWVLMEAGANYHFTNPRFSWQKRLNRPHTTPPGSPLFAYKEKVWRKLCESGIEVPPLTSKKMWEYLNKWGGTTLAPARMPIITCDNRTHRVKGKWGKLKPKVISAYDALKARGNR